MWQLIRQISLAIITAIVLLLVVFGWRYIQQPSVYPIKTIKFSGSYHYVKPERLQQVVKPYINSGFFSVNLSGVMQSVRKMPWVSEAHVERVWPDTLVVRFTEQKPVARWEGYAVLNEQGVLFEPDVHSIPADLPIFYGETTEAPEILHNYQQLQEMLKSVSLRVTQVHVSPAGSYWITLGNGTVLRLGKKDLAERLDHYIDSYHQVFKSKSHAVESVDLRYPSGMAVKWRNKAYKNTQHGSQRGYSTPNVKKTG